jgi:hypothetical protein
VTMKLSADCCWCCSIVVDGSNVYCGGRSFKSSSKRLSCKCIMNFLSTQKEQTQSEKRETNLFGLVLMTLPS